MSLFRVGTIRTKPDIPSDHVGNTADRLREKPTSVKGRLQEFVNHLFFNYVHIRHFARVLLPRGNKISCWNYRREVQQSIVQQQQQ